MIVTLPLPSGSGPCDLLVVEPSDHVSAAVRKPGIDGRRDRVEVVQLGLVGHDVVCTGPGIL